MNRKHLIEHFKGLAELMGKTIRMAESRNGARIVCNGRSIVLPHRSRKITYVGLLESRLGLRPPRFS